jgi:hypothetical protein
VALQIPQDCVTVALPNPHICFDDGRYQFCRTISAMALPIPQRLFEVWRYQLHTVIYRIDSLQKTAGLFWIDATKCAEYFARALQKLATQRATEWRYELAPGIKEFKFITLLGG